ncbi:MAG: DUF4412 domain-containing protein [Anaerolineae bacterium]|nr:DUF4412 domain-containing protein [Gemmatimonadaceae bacterium]
MTAYINRLVLPCVVAAVTTFAADNLAAQPTFEGILTMKVSGPQNTVPRTMKYYVRNGVMRLEMEGKDGPQGYTITDPRKQVSYTVVPGQRMYMEMAAAPNTVEKINKTEPQITRTGRTETIAGHKCEHWIIKSEAEESDVCVAKGLGKFFGAASGGQGEPAWIRKLGADFFPLRYSKAGETRAALEVTRIEKRSLDASLFEPPAGFKKVTIPAAGPPRKP